MYPGTSCGLRLFFSDAFFRTRIWLFLQVSGKHVLQKQVSASFVVSRKNMLEWFKTSKNAVNDEICKYKSGHVLECLIPRFKNIFLLANTGSTQKLEITGTCMFSTCMQKHFSDMFLFIFACKYQTCRYKFRTCICGSGTCTKKHVFACTHWTKEKTSRNQYLQVWFLLVKTCMNTLFIASTCKY